MNKQNKQNIVSSFRLALLHQLMDALLNQYDIPSNTRRLALNLKVNQFYKERSGIQPVEIQLERLAPHKPWEVRFVASFDYPTSKAKHLDVSLYFNFKYLWFYQPDIERCELCRPEVQSLFLSWLKAFNDHLRKSKFDTQSLTVISLFS